MLKKIIVAGAMLSLFACSSVDDGFVYGSSDSQGNVTNDSSSSQDSPSSSSSVSSSSSEPESSSSSEPEPSSSSKGPDEVLISEFGSQGGGLSVLFKTSPYGYTLKAGSEEDLTQFWQCPTAQQDKKPDILACEQNKTEAILQNYLTTQYSPLHYIINNMITANSQQYSIKLDRYNLTEEGDQAALGLNVSDDDKNIEDVGKLDTLSGIVGFSYFYAGGAHKFRIAVDDADFWYADVPEQAKEGLVTINVSDLKGMGSFAENETPFDIAKVKKFLWVVEFDSETSANNAGSLLVYLFNALIEK